MMGDVAVAVHPSDERYKALVGKKVMLPLANREIEIIADEYVDPEFGTGMVKITPAHDPNDFLVGNRHNLQRINTMNDDASMNELAGKYNGMDRFDARKAIVADLEELGLMLAIEPIVHSVGHSERTGVQVESRLSTQWFVKMQPLAEQALDMQKVKTALSLSLLVLKIPLLVGWMISMTGLSHGNYGGVTKSQRGTTKRLVKLMLVKKHLRILKTGNKITMCLIHGSQVLYGHLQPWVGQILMKKTLSVTSQLQR